MMVLSSLEALKAVIMTAFDDSSDDKICDRVGSCHYDTFENIQWRQAFNNDGLVQEKIYSSALAMELRLSCI